jgi:hypothetical protein
MLGGTMTSVGTTKYVLTHMIVAEENFCVEHTHLY